MWDPVTLLKTKKEEEIILIITDNYYNQKNKAMLMMTWVIIPYNPCLRHKYTSLIQVGLRLGQD